MVLTRVTLLLLCSPVPAGLAAQNAAITLNLPPQSQARREPGTARIIAQLAAGILGAWLGGVAGYQVIAGIADDRTVKGDAGYSPAGNVGYVVGSAVGSAAASSIAGSLLRMEGSFPGALVGGSIPSTILLLGLDEPYMPLIGAIFVAPLQSAGASIGFRALF